MKCQSVLDNYTAYSDYDLTSTDREKIENHLMECQSCRETFQNLDTMVQDLGQLSNLEVSANFNHNLMTKIAEVDEIPINQSWYQLPAVRMGGYAIAAGVALALVFSQWMNPVNSRTPGNAFPTASQIQHSVNPTTEYATNDSVNNSSDSLDLVEPNNMYPEQELHLVNQTP